MIFDVTTLTASEYHEPGPYKIANFIDKCCVCSDCSTGHSPISLALLQPSYSLRHGNVETGPVNPTMASGCSSERKSHTLNQKLEMLMVSKEGMLKAEIGLLSQLKKL